MIFVSYDARGTAPEKGTHWAADSSLGERAYFRYKDEPSRLELRNIREGDLGLYRCRVDFRKSPTRNSKVNLTIIRKSSNVPQTMLSRKKLYKQIETASLPKFYSL